jgi:hypothetical protein
MLGKRHAETSSAGTTSLSHVAEPQATESPVRSENPCLRNAMLLNLQQCECGQEKQRNRTRGTPKTLALQPQDVELTFSASLLCVEPLIPPRTVRSEAHGPATSCNSDTRGRLLHDPTTETVRGEGQVQRAI